MTTKTGRGGVRKAPKGRPGQTGQPEQPEQPEQPDRPKGPAPLYAFRIELLEIKPKIWRRFFCPSDLSLDQFHEVLQVVMGWNGGHLHSFRIGGRDFYDDPDGPQDPLDAFKGLPAYMIPAITALIGELKSTPRTGLDRISLGGLNLAVNQHFSYLYDFGDNWDHDLRVVSLDYKPKDPSLRYGCLAGARACPPEDCGGVGGYQELLEVLAEPGKDHDGLLDWHEGYDPEFFDAEDITRSFD